MRIISGKFGGRKLEVPKNKDIRPTGDKIRGAIFNMLVSRDAVDGANVLDAFCGTGALGLEALSRGANHCTFMDVARDSLDLARKNAQNFDVEWDAHFILKDARKVRPSDLGDRGCFDLVFLDPPYTKGLIAPCLEALSGGMLVQGAWVVCESERALDLSMPKGYVLESERVYKDTKIMLLQWRG